MTWRTVPLKRVASIRVSNVDKKSVDGESQVRLCNYTDVYYRDSIHPSQDFMRATANREQISAFRLKTEDVIITKDSESADDIGVPAYVEADAADLVCGYHLALIRPLPNTINGRFLFWAMASSLMQSQLEVAATGITRFGLRADAIGSATLELPPLAQQRAIADFLDAETARIDALIEKKHRMLSLLEERESTWLEGCLADSVDHVSIRRLLRKPPQYGAVESGSPERTGPRYLRITDLAADGTVKSAAPRYLSAESAKPYILNHGDILVARSGATVGKSFLYSADMESASFAGYLIRLAFDPTRIHPELINAWMHTRDYWGQIGMSGSQVTIQNVNAEQYKSLVVPVPTHEVQRTILRQLKARREKVRRIQSSLTLQLELLTEHRQALITAAVTGRVEIPGVGAWQANK